MKFLADQNCDFAVVRTLRDADYEVLTVSDVSPGASDVLIIESIEGLMLLASYPLNVKLSLRDWEKAGVTFLFSPSS